MESSEHVTDASAGGDDLISGLPDDALLRILGFVAAADARDAARTDALSRRWRGLWARVPSLSLSSSSLPEFPSGNVEERFIAVVDDVLAKRARSGVRIERLEIWLFTPRGGHLPWPPAVPCFKCIRAAEGWIWYAAQREVASLVVFLDLGGYLHWIDHRARLALGDLPSSAKLETMSLMLDGVEVWLPATAAFESLVDLTLESMFVLGDSSHLLARLISSECCPRLQKLSMTGIGLAGNLLVEAGALLELSLGGIPGLYSMELRTPNLRVLHVQNCMNLSALTVSAPRLGELTLSLWRTVVHGDLSSVWSLSIMVHSWFPVDKYTVKDEEDSIYLLQRCSSARSLTVTLYEHSKIYWQGPVNIIKDRIPQLPHFTSLIVDVNTSGERHSSRDGLASLLTRFNGLRYLRLQLNVCCSDEEEIETSTFICDHPINDWKSTDISLAHLQEAEFRGLTGTDCELRFLKFVLATAKDLQKVIVGFNKDYSLEGRRDDFQHMLLEAGTWTPTLDADDLYVWDANESYVWRPS
ncbi:hypothetical protein ACP70R_024216 [Stipagrostis hirtigluma subsp. patula]